MSNHGHSHGEHHGHSPGHHGHSHGHHSHGEHHGAGDASRGKTFDELADAFENMPGVQRTNAQIAEHMLATLTGPLGFDAARLAAARVRASGDVGSMLGSSLLCVRCVLRSSTWAAGRACWRGS